MAHTVHTLPFTKPSKSPREPRGRGSWTASSRSEIPPAPLVGVRPTDFANLSADMMKASPLAGAARCEEKGCIFPPAFPGLYKCIHHLRQQREPTMFHSRQPTVLLLDRARFGPPHPADTGERARDRRRLVMLRQELLDEAS